MFKLFVTGATGYIGGDFVHVASQAHPEWEISCLVRDAGKGHNLAAAFPHIRIVLGNLDSTRVIEAEAAQCHAVFSFASSDHLKSAQAIAKGLKKNRSPLAFWIHTSGAGILTFENFAKSSFGYALPSDSKVYDDWDGIKELTSLPDKALHRHVDKVVLGASLNQKHIRTAVVAPSCIYGTGRGTGNTASVQVHVATRVTLAAKKALQVGDGSNVWHEVHIRDLSQMYLLLGQAASAGGEPATWNDRGYYLAESGSFTWGEITRRIGSEGFRQEYLSTAEVCSVDFEEARARHQHFPYLCGTTSRGIAKRARILLAWQPKESRMKEEIGRVVKLEAARAGIPKVRSSL